jgi:predicted GNAT family acetyltransferase
VQVPAALRGQGIAAVLCRAAFAHAKDEGIKVVPTCELWRWSLVCACVFGAHACVKLRVSAALVVVLPPPFTGTYITETFLLKEPEYNDLVAHL